MRQSGVGGWAIECEEVIFSAVNTLIAADTGTGGLKNSSFSGFIRNGPHLVDVVDAKEPGDYPSIEVQIHSRDISPCPGGAAVSGTDECFDNTVTFWCIDDRDQRAGRRVNRTAARVRQIFNYATLTAIVDTDAWDVSNSRKWYFSPMARIDLRAATPTDTEVRIPVSFRLIVSKGTA